MRKDMIKSMTGYGKAEYVYADHKTMVEIRSLNSKQLDLNLKTAPLFREKEWEIRGLLTGPLERGKVDVSIMVQGLESGTGACLATINREAAKHYYREMMAILDEVDAEEVQGRDAVLLQAVMRMPEVVQGVGDATELSAQEWSLLQKAIEEALTEFQAFREQEGRALEAMFEEKLSGIEELLASIEPYEKGRVQAIKERLLNNLETLKEATKQEIDQNRLEAELIYYLEKLDVTEEKVRLRNHIRYFRETVRGEGLAVSGVGKKLGFVAQEMGREINTLGSKSNQSEMQIIVVKMKDLLEQIKEQVLNVL